MSEPVNLTEAREHAPWSEFADGSRLCHGCGLPCLPEDHPVTSKDGGHYKHFTCWYDNVVPARLKHAGRGALAASPGHCVKCGSIDPAWHEAYCSTVTDGYGAASQETER